MRDFLRVGIALLICSGAFSSAQSQTNPSDTEKSSSTSESTAATEALPKVCSKTNPPPCATAPRLVSAPRTTFSKQAGSNIHGVCVLSVIVEPDGHTSHIHVTKGLGLDMDEEAMHAVKNWKFKPATMNGKPIAMQIPVEVQFNLY